MLIGDTVIVTELKKTMHLFKYQDHLDLFELTSSNTLTSFGECTKSAKKNVTLQIMKSPWMKGEDYISLIFLLPYIHARGVL